MRDNFNDIDPKITIKELIEKLGKAEAYRYLACLYKRIPKILMAQDIIDEVTNGR